MVNIHYHFHLKNIKASTNFTTTKKKKKKKKTNVTMNVINIFTQKKFNWYQHTK